MQVFKWVAGVLGAVSLTILLLTVCIQIPTFGVWFYEKEFAKNNTYEVVGVEKDDLLAVTKHMLRYMENKKELLNIETTVRGEPMLFFSDRAVYHMNDVKDLFVVGFAVQKGVFFLVVLALAVFASPWLKKERRVLYGCVTAVSALILTGAAVLGLVVAMDFDAAFTTFHEIFFTNDMWLLEWDDRLLNIVPTPFFIDIALFICISFAVLLIGMVVLGIVGLRWEKKKA